MTLQRRQEHGFTFEKMLAEELKTNESDDLKFDCMYGKVPMQVKTTSGRSLRLGRYRNGLEVSRDFYLVYAVHKDRKITEVKSFLIDGLEYNKQFTFIIQHYFDEVIKPLPDRSGHYKEYCDDIKFMAKSKLVMPEVKKGGGGNNRLQSYIQIKDIPSLGTEVDLGLSKFLTKEFETA